MEQILGGEIENLKDNLEVEPARAPGEMLRPVLLFFLIGTSLILSVFFVLSPTALSSKYPDAVHEIRASGDLYSGPSVFDPIKSVVPPSSVSLSPLHDPSSISRRYDFKLSSTDTFYGIMSLFDIPGSEVNEIIRKASPVYDLRRLLAGSVLTVRTDAERPVSIEYGIDEFERLVVERGGSSGAYSASRVVIPKEVRTSVVSGAIETSLYEDGLKAGADAQTILSLSDIFAWDVDFASDIRRGDTFKIYYETVFAEGRPVRSGNVLAAEMVNDGRRFTAVYFEDSKGRGGYYDTEGKSLRRTLLKSPLRYSRISSRFSRSRFHPILKKYRPHHGVDYAAPPGTPVEAAGGGRVLHAGWKSGYGYMVEIKHNNSYVTAYGHLSRFKPGIRAGAIVEQGDVIGFVGSTGISTGPHLHYEIRQAGRLVNPLGLKAEPNRSVPKEDLQRFASVRDTVLSKLATGAPSTMVASGGSTNR